MADEGFSMGGEVSSEEDPDAGTTSTTLTPNKSAAQDLATPPVDSTGLNGTVLTESPTKVAPSSLQSFPGSSSAEDSTPAPFMSPWMGPSSAIHSRNLQTAENGPTTSSTNPPTTSSTSPPPSSVPSPAALASSTSPAPSGPSLNHGQSSRGTAVIVPTQGFSSDLPEFEKKTSKWAVLSALLGNTGPKAEPQHIPTQAALSSPCLDVLPPALWSLVLEYLCRPEIVLSYYLEVPPAEDNEEGKTPLSKVCFVLRDDGNVWYTRSNQHDDSPELTEELMKATPIFRTQVDFNKFMTHNEEGTWVFDVSLQRLLVGHLREVTPGIYQPLTYAYSGMPTHTVTVKYRDLRHTTSVDAYPHLRTPTAFKAVVQKLAAFETGYAVPHGAAMQLLCDGSQQHILYVMTILSGYAVPHGAAMQLLCDGSQHILQTKRVKAGLSPWAHEDIMRAIRQVHSTLDLDHDGRISMEDTLDWVERYVEYARREEALLKEQDELLVVQGRVPVASVDPSVRRMSATEQEKKNMMSAAESLSTGRPPRTIEERKRALWSQAQKWSSSNPGAQGEEHFVRNCEIVLAGLDWDWTLFMHSQFPMCLLEGREEIVTLSLTLTIVPMCQLKGREEMFLEPSPGSRNLKYLVQFFFKRDTRRDTWILDTELFNYRLTIAPVKELVTYVQFREYSSQEKRLQVPVLNLRHCLLCVQKTFSET
eukprot:g56759.t1